MRKAVLRLAVASLFVATGGHAIACDGGKVVFEDKFNDDAGGWALKDTIEVKDGTFTFKLPPDDMQSNLNITFSVNDADICADAVWPEGDDQPVLGAGLLFWGEDNRTYYQFGILNNGRFWIARKQDGDLVRHHRRQYRLACHQDGAGRGEHATRRRQGQHARLLHQRHQGTGAAGTGAVRRLALRPVRRQLR